MAPEERFQNLGRSPSNPVENVALLAQLVPSYVDSSNARIEANRDAIRELTAVVEKFIESGDARLRRIEDNLDALIRAITAEHSNGHGSSRTS